MYKTILPDLAAKPNDMSIQKFIKPFIFLGLMVNLSQAQEKTVTN